MRRTAGKADCSSFDSADLPAETGKVDRLVEIAQIDRGDAPFVAIARRHHKAADANLGRSMRAV
jgi:hypothetical protein